MTTASFVLAAAQLLAPGRDHAVLSNAIAARVDAEAPLFQGDTDRKRTAAYLTAIAFRESSLTLNVVGDHGKSFCAFQIHVSSGGSPALLTDADACVGAAFAMLRTSIRTCPAFPLAWYAEGPTGCASARAQRISRDRMAIAARLVRDVKEPTTAALFFGLWGEHPCGASESHDVTSRASGLVCRSEASS